MTQEAQEGEGQALPRLGKVTGSEAEGESWQPSRPKRESQLAFDDTKEHGQLQASDCEKEFLRRGPRAGLHMARAGQLLAPQTLLSVIWT